MTPESAARNFPAIHETGTEKPLRRTDSEPAQELILLS